MTFAEVVIFILLAVGICLALAPLQKRLEKILYKFFRSKSSNPGPIIDITDYKKKEKHDG